MLPWSRRNRKKWIDLLDVVGLQVTSYKLQLVTSVLRLQVTSLLPLITIDTIISRNI